MAAEIQVVHDQTGETLYGVIRDALGQCWNTAMSAFGARAVANWTDYDIALAETPASSYFYVGTFPAAIPAGFYWLDIYVRGGANPAITDFRVESLLGYWDGTTFSLQAADVRALSEDAVAADALETMLDGTGGATLTLARLVLNCANAGGAIDIDNTGGPGIRVDATTFGIDLLAGWTGIRSEGTAIRGMDIIGGIVGILSSGNLMGIMGVAADLAAGIGIIGQGPHVGVEAHGTGGAASHGMVAHSTVLDGVGFAVLNSGGGTALGLQGDGKALGILGPADLLDVILRALVLQSTTIAVLTSQTVFTLTAGSADDDAYNGAFAVVRDAVTAIQRCVGFIEDYDGGTKRVTLASSPGVFTMAAGDLVDILPGQAKVVNAAIAAAHAITDAAMATKPTLAQILGMNVDSTGVPLTNAKALEVLVAFAMGNALWDPSTKRWVVYGRDGTTIIAQGRTDGAGTRTESEIP